MFRRFAVVRCAAVLCAVGSGAALVDSGALGLEDWLAQVSVARTCLTLVSLAGWSGLPHPLTHWQALATRHSHFFLPDFSSHTTALASLGFALLSRLLNFAEQENRCQRYPQFYNPLTPHHKTHNPALLQLSYSSRRFELAVRIPSSIPPSNPETRNANSLHPKLRSFSAFRQSIRRRGSGLNLTTTPAPSQLLSEPQLRTRLDLCRLADCRVRQKGRNEEKNRKPSASAQRPARSVLTTMNPHH